MSSLKKLIEWLEDRKTYMQWEDNEVYIDVDRVIKKARSLLSQEQPSEPRTLSYDEALTYVKEHGSTEMKVNGYIHLITVKGQEYILTPETLSSASIAWHESCIFELPPKVEESVPELKPSEKIVTIARKRGSCFYPTGRMDLDYFMQHEPDNLMQAVIDYLDEQYLLKMQK